MKIEEAKLLLTFFKKGVADSTVEEDGMESLIKVLDVAIGSLDSLNKVLNEMTAQVKADSKVEFVEIQNEVWLKAIDIIRKHIAEVENEN